jgi:hypothetical protein
VPLGPVPRVRARGAEAEQDLQRGAAHAHAHRRVRTATESRSLSENKLYALRRLKLKLASDLREPIDLATFEPPEWFLSIRHDNRIAASHRHPLFAAAGGLILDLLQALGGNPAAVAINLGVSTTAVIKLLETEPHLWAAANHIRARSGARAAGAPALKWAYKPVPALEWPGALVPRIDD